MTESVCIHFTCPYSCMHSDTSSLIISLFPPSFCLDDWGNGQGTEKVKWLCPLSSSSSSSPPLSLMCMRGGAERRSQQRTQAWNCRMVMKPIRLSCMNMYVCGTCAGIDIYLLLKRPPSVSYQVVIHIFIYSPWSLCSWSIMQTRGSRFNRCVWAFVDGGQKGKKHCKVCNEKALK